MEPSELKSRLDSLPNHAGVYLMKDREAVIYVGKANRLKQRVRQYFQSSGDTRYFITLLPKLIGDIETITTHNPKEALILENELIKKYQPRFNVLLRDDKSFLHIRIDVKSDYQGSLLLGVLNQTALATLDLIIPPPNYVRR